MSRKEEVAPLLMPKPASSSLPAQNAAAKKQFTPSRPKLHNIQYPEVRLELILYGELAAAAALVVAVYLLALLPWVYVQRSQLIAARMKPAGISADDVHHFLKKCPKRLDIVEGKADPHINEFVNIHLTGRPCGLADWSNMLHHDRDCFDTPADSDCGCNPTQQHTKTNRILPRVLYISATQSSKLSYHDMMNYGFLTCCHPDPDQTPYCPCGFRYIDGFCFGFSDKDCASYKRVTSLDNFNITSPAGKKYLDINDIVYLCLNGKSQLNYRVCRPDQTDLIFINKDDDPLVLCQADLVNPYSWNWMNELRTPVGKDDEKKNDE
uniref:DUF1559 domain-containing protein n=1 Tax=Panagrellus redivivus TaxID=6233 RepID=A0A7E4ZYR3_PANRE